MQTFSTLFLHLSSHRVLHIKEVADPQVRDMAPAKGWLNSFGYAICVSSNNLSSFRVFVVVQNYRAYVRGVREKSDGENDR
jgi:hypothetical protein